MAPRGEPPSRRLTAGRLCGFATLKDSSSTCGRGPRRAPRVIGHGECLPASFGGGLATQDEGHWRWVIKGSQVAFHNRTGFGLVGVLVLAACRAAVASPEAATAAVTPTIESPSQQAAGQITLELRAIRLAAGQVTYAALLRNAGEDSFGGLSLEVSLPQVPGGSFKVANPHKRPAVNLLEGGSPGGSIAVAPHPQEERRVVPGRIVRHLTIEPQRRRSNNRRLL